MALGFDTARKHIVLDLPFVSAERIWSEWVAWHANNRTWPLALRQTGRDAVGGGRYSPNYFFLMNGWRLRPMEANHDLEITGNIVPDGGGTPVVRTLGPYQVNVGYVVPERAQGISTTGASGPSAAEIAAAVWAYPFAQKLLTVAKFLGLK